MLRPVTMRAFGVALVLLPNTADAQMIMIRDMGALRGQSGQLVLRGGNALDGVPWFGASGNMMLRGFGTGDSSLARGSPGVLMERTEKLWMPADGSAVRRQEVEEHDRVTSDGRREVQRVTCSEGGCEGTMVSGSPLAPRIGGWIGTRALRVQVPKPSMSPAMAPKQTSQAQAQLEDLAGHVLDYAAEKARARAFVENHPGVRWEVETDDGREEDAAQLAADHGDGKALAQMDAHGNRTANAPNATVTAISDGIHHGFEAMADMYRVEDDVQKDAITRLFAKSDAFSDAMEREAVHNAAKRKSIESENDRLLGGIVRSSQGAGQVQAPTLLEDVSMHVLGYGAEKSHAIPVVEDHPGIGYEVETDDGRKGTLPVQMDGSGSLSADSPKATAQAISRGIHVGFEAMIDMDRAEDDAQKDAISKLDREADAFNENLEMASGIGMDTGLPPA